MQNSKLKMFAWVESDNCDVIYESFIALWKTYLHTYMKIKYNTIKRDVGICSFP